jgi:membrane protein implicated in regulation of membrane protease activity
MLTFALIGGVGLILAIITFALGEIGPDFDTGGHDFHVDTGTDMHVDSDHVSGPNPLSLRTFSMFVTMFGAVGALVMFYGGSVLLASILSTIGGFIGGWVMWIIIKAIYKQQGNSTISAQQLVGSTARIVSAVSKNVPGEVIVQFADQRHDMIAFASEDVSIPIGSEVQIIAVNGNSVIVQPITRT